MGRGTALKPSKGRKARACLAASLKGVYHPTKETQHREIQDRKIQQGKTYERYSQNMEFVCSIQDG